MQKLDGTDRDSERPPANTEDSLRHAGTPWN